MSTGRSRTGPRCDVQITGYTDSLNGNEPCGHSDVSAGLAPPGRSATARPKASDITDEAFLAAMREDASRLGYGVAMLDGVTDLLGLPRKVVQAKARSLIKRGLIDGCDCGCRGDFEPTNSASSQTHDTP